MRQALVKIHNNIAGIFKEENSEYYTFQYDETYNGQPISLTMPLRRKAYEFKSFPPFFDGLLPEGTQLEGLLKKYKIDKNDFFKQLLVTGLDLVGAVTIEQIDSNE